MHLWERVLILGWSTPLWPVGCTHRKSYEWTSYAQLAENAIVFRRLPIRGMIRQGTDKKENALPWASFSKGISFCISNNMGRAPQVIKCKAQRGK